MEPLGEPAATVDAAPDRRLLAVDSLASLSRIGFWGFLLGGLGLLLGSIGWMVLFVDILIQPIQFPPDLLLFLWLFVAGFVFPLIISFLLLAMAFVLRARRSPWRLSSLVVLLGAFIPIIQGIRAIVLQVRLNVPLAAIPGSLALMGGIFFLIAWALHRSGQVRIRRLGVVFSFVGLGLWLAAVLIGANFNPFQGGFPVGIPDLFQPLGFFGGMLTFTALAFASVAALVDLAVTPRGRPLTGILVGVAGIFFSLELLTGFFLAVLPAQLAIQLAGAPFVPVGPVTGLTLAAAGLVLVGILGLLGLIASIWWIGVQARSLDKGEPVVWEVSPMPFLPQPASVGVPSGFCGQCGAIKTFGAVACPNCGMPY